MAGGTWVNQNKVRPGAYINVNSTTLDRGASTERGIVTMPWHGGFGSANQVITVNRSTDFLRVLGHNLSDMEMLTVREALKRATTVLLYRVNANGVAATVSTNDLTITATSTGTVGNNITVRIVAPIVSGDAYTVQTFVGDILADSQSVNVYEDLVTNDFVTFDGTGAPEASAGLNLVGGANGIATIGDYMDYFGVVEAYEFNTMAITSTTQQVKDLAINFVMRMREDEGMKCQVVVADASADSEAVIVVTNGVVLTDGTAIDANKATAWVAGATAGANVNESNTYTPYDGAVDIQGRMTNAEIVNALRSGQIVFAEHNGRIVVEQDINSLTTFTAMRNQAFSKNRVMRVLDDIANTIKRIFATNFIGQITNDENGRAVFKSAVVAYMENLLAMGAIENFDVDDVVIDAGIQRDTVVANLAVQPTDAMEKLYMTVEVH